MTRPNDTPMLPQLTVQQAARFIDVALVNIAQEYPHKLDHVTAEDADALPPRILHPAFHGSYDWHSCVHMHWLLVHLRRRFAHVPQRAAIGAVCERHFAEEAIAAECAYLERPHSEAFERTYGWAWLLKLADELHRSDDADAQRWYAQLRPLSTAIESRYSGHLPQADYPIRYGIHSNSAFGLLFALAYARRTGAGALEALCLDKARAWFGDDHAAPARWEPSGADFLSPALMEATLMRKVLSVGEFAVWLGEFLPGIEDRQPATLFTPARVSDRNDPQIVHLDGLNLSRAWCWREIGSALDPADPRTDIAFAAARVHLKAGLRGLEQSHYVGSHWLASFAALALGA